MSFSLADAYIRLRYDKSALDSDLRSVKSLVTSSLAGVATVGTGILAAMGFRELTRGITGIAGAMVSANAEMENYRTSLGALLRDQDQANKLIREIEVMSQQTPFEISTLLHATQLLKGYGFQVGEIVPLLNSLGDAAAAAPDGMASGMLRIALALGQMKAKGKIAGQEVLQLANAGIPVWQILSEQAGKSISEVQEMVKKGTISGEQGIKMLVAGMGERFEGVMLARSKSFEGLMSTARDLGKIMLRDIGEPVFELSKMRLDNLVEWMRTDDAKEFAESMKETVTWAAKLSETIADLAAAIAGLNKMTVGENVTRFFNQVLGLDNPASRMRAVEEMSSRGRSGMERVVDFHSRGGEEGQRRSFEDIDSLRSEARTLLNDIQQQRAELMGAELKAMQRVEEASRMTRGARRGAIGGDPLEHAQTELAAIRQQLDLSAQAADRIAGIRDRLTTVDLPATVERTQEELGRVADLIGTVGDRIADAASEFDFSGAARTIMDKITGGMAQAVSAAARGREKLIADMSEALGVSEEQILKGIERTKKDEETREKARRLGLDTGKVEKDDPTDEQIRRFAEMTGRSEAAVREAMIRSKREREEAEAMAALGIGGFDDPVPKQVQFSAIDQLARQIQTSLTDDRETRIQEDIKKATEETKESTKKSADTLMQIERKLPSPAGFTA
jgi:tape measure domain-containing protein